LSVAVDQKADWAPLWGINIGEILANQLKQGVLLPGRILPKERQLWRPDLRVDDAIVARVPLKTPQRLEGR
jgi:hypothetical protein